MLGKFVTRCLLLVLGYAYPAFLCFKTVEKNRVQIEELRHWCQYWIIVALFTVVERIGDVLISWIPMYWELKLGIIIYLWHPKTKGTGYVYETVLRPFMATHEREIDMKLVEWEARAWDFVSFYWQNCWEFVDVAFSRAMQYWAAQSSSSNTKGRGRSGSINRSMSGTPKSHTGEMNPNVQTEYVYVEDEIETETEQQEVRDHEDACPTKEEDKTRASGHRLRRSRTSDCHID
ncbi:putative HVA22-like protein g isoform X2 [Rhodamnia argentea]|uniref:HVA22-like protein n=1 Tax=Rhodamnia argentea TaxID=178133 RepID=A0A8B8QNH1_9MYRT|nr:putative HVA22-like protein g isoform X2 [Rhodamnia argentea]